MKLSGLYEDVRLALRSVAGENQKLELRLLSVITGNTFDVTDT